jgi:hypothetical protein
MQQRLGPALVELNDLLEKASKELHTSIQFAVIGGLAVAAWGVIRATQDIDILANSNPTPLVKTELRGELSNFLDRNGCHTEWRVGVLRGSDSAAPESQSAADLGEIGADILWAHKHWQQQALQRSVAIDVLKRRVNILHPEDLILMKLDAGGPQDLFDVKQMLSAPPPQLNIEQLRASAARLRLGRAFNKCLREARNDK